jgi:hypothetical protein
VEPNPLLEKVEQKSKPFRNPLLGNPINIWVIGLNMEVNFPTMDLDQPFPKVEWIF